MGMLTNPKRSARATQKYEAGNKLSETNRLRTMGAAFHALRAGEASASALKANDYHFPTTTLREYHQHAEAALVEINAGREPYLVNSEALSFGMHPLIEVWDVGIDTVKVARGGRARGAVEMVLVCTKSGDGLLDPDSLVLWK